MSSEYENDKELQWYDGKGLPSNREVRSTLQPTGPQWSKPENQMTSFLQDAVHRKPELKFFGKNLSEIERASFRIDNELYQNSKELKKTYKIFTFS